MQISANLSVDDRSALARSTDAKSDSTDRVDERVGLLTVDLAANASDIDVDDVGGRIKMQIPYMLQQHRPRNDLACVANQILEDLEFPRQQRDEALPAADGPGHQVEFEIADAQHGLLDDGGASSRERLDPRQQFRERERLDEVVVAARPQASHTVIDLAERADDQRRRDDPGIPQAADDGDSVHAGQHAVDRHDGVFGGAPALESFIAVDGEVDLVAAGGQRIHELLGGLRVVLDDENASPGSGHGSSLPCRHSTT